MDPNTKSLRELMMKIKTKYKTEPLFLGINKDKRGDRHFVTSPTANETEARDMLSHFGSYLAYVQKAKKYCNILLLKRANKQAKQHGILYQRPIFKKITQLWMN